MTRVSTFLPRTSYLLGRERPKQTAQRKDLFLIARSFKHFTPSLQLLPSSVARPLRLSWALTGGHDTRALRLGPPSSALLTWARHRAMCQAVGCRAVADEGRTNALKFFGILFVVSYLLFLKGGLWRT